MKKKKELYPCVAEVEAEKQKFKSFDTLNVYSDFIGGKPNYNKFKNWNSENVLAWLNID